MILKNINKLKKVFIVLLGIGVLSCADPDLAPIVTFDSAGHGAYPRLIVGSEEGSLVADMFSQADFDASFYTYSVEFVDAAKGKNVAQYILNIEYDDVNGTNSSGPIEFRTYAPSDFSSDGDYIAMNDITVTANEVAGAFGLTYSDLNLGDAFILTGTLVQSNGSQHTSANSSATVRGGAFIGHFDYNMVATCPTTLAGEYDFVTDLSGWDSGDNSGSASGTVEIFQLASGSWSFSDWSFGGYNAEYGCCTPAGDFRFDEQCSIATFYDATDSYGDEWRITVTIPDANTLHIDWENYTYGASIEQGITDITFPDGVPFTF